MNWSKWPLSWTVWAFVYATQLIVWLVAMCIQPDETACWVALLIIGALYVLARAYEELRP